MRFRQSWHLADIERWERVGWVTPSGAVAIRNDLAAQRSNLRFAGVLATLAAILIGFGAMSFVAANWQEMSKLARLGVIFAGLWATLGGAALLAHKGFARFAEAAMLTAVTIYGAGIMLIAQMYHMDGHPPDAVLLWAIGAVAAGLLAQSRSALAAALVLLLVWSGMESFGEGLYQRIHWGFLPAWGLVAAGFALTGWKPGINLLGLTMVVWLIESAAISDGTRLFNGGVENYNGRLALILIGTAAMFASDAARVWSKRWPDLPSSLMLQGAIVAFAGAYLMQMTAWRGNGILMFGILILAGILGVLALAWRNDFRGALWFAYAAFTVEIVTLYVTKIGTLLGSAGFFVGAGLIVAALAFAAHRLHAETSTRIGVRS